MCHNCAYNVPCSREICSTYTVLPGRVRPPEQFVGLKKRSRVGHILKTFLNVFLTLLVRITLQLVFVTDSHNMGHVGVHAPILLLILLGTARLIHASAQSTNEKLAPETERRKVGQQQSGSMSVSPAC